VRTYDFDCLPEAGTNTAPVLKKVLPVELKNANVGRGHSWHSTAASRKRIAKRLANERREPFAYPVAILLTRILGPGQRLWDADSVGRGNAKELIDSLVELGWFHDDGPKWITHCDYRQDASQRINGPSVLIEVFKTGDT